MNLTQPAWSATLSRFLLAAQARPDLAMAGLLAFARGRKVRARRLIGTAAAENHDYYRHWVRYHESAVIQRWLDQQDIGQDAVPPRMGLVVVGDDHACKTETIASAQEALPSAVIIDKNDGLDGILANAVGQHCDWLLALDAGTKVSPFLGRILASRAAASAPLVYWDSDRLGSRGRCDPWIKPDWDPWLMRSNPYLGQDCAISVSKARDFAAKHRNLAQFLDFPGLQLGIAASSDEPPVHIPLILTHGCAEGTNLRPGQAQLAAWGFSSRKAQNPWPVVSVIIPTRDEAAMLARLIDRLDHLTYPGEIELLVVDNGSVEPATMEYFASLSTRPLTRILRYPEAFNFSAMINLAARQAEGEFLCLLNNDVEPKDNDWLTVLMREATAENVGAVGARLLYPDGTIQHVGVAIGLGGAAGHVQKNVRPDDPLFATWHNALRRVSAVTAACLVVARKKFEAAGGFDEVAFQVDFNDVDFCMKLDSLGLANLVVPDAMLIHHESKTRGRGHSGATAIRFNHELAILQQRWHTETWRDPWHSVLFSPTSERCLLTT